MIQSRTKSTYHTEQFKLFTRENDNVEREPLLMIGGIYTEINPDHRDPLGPYSICFGSNQFYAIFDGIDHIENIVELCCAHRMMKVDGYGLKVNLIKKTISIVNSGKTKDNPEYCIWKGEYSDPFWESMQHFRKIFHM